MASTTHSRRATSAVRWGLGLSAVLFGMATLVEGGHVLFGGPAARAEAGNIVPFVLAFNFAAGFVYVIAGLGIMTRRRWVLGVARSLAVSTLLVFAMLGVHIVAGGAFEARTVMAMTLRSAFWVAQALALARILDGKPIFRRS